MKKVLFVLAAAMCFSCASVAQTSEKEIKKAQKEAQKLVRQAREELNDTESGDINKALSLIEQAMTNQYTKDKAETWSVAGDIYKSLYSKESNKVYLNQPYDTVNMYENLIKMYDYYFKCDELEQIPNEKGKVSQDCRLKNAEELDRNRTNFINAGIFYFNSRHDYAKAYQMFDKYYQIGEVPMLKSYTDANPDYAKYAVEFAYFPTLAAIQMEDYEKVLKYCDKGVEDPENGETCYRFKCEAYSHLKDTANWVKALQGGVEKFPTVDYYYMQLIVYYDNTQQVDEMETFAQSMLDKDPDKAYNYYVIGYIKQNKKAYDDAISNYLKAIEKDPVLSEAYINCGICYMLQANDYMEANANVKYGSTAYKKMMETEQDYYKKAQPMWEKVRELKPDDTKTWGLQLYQIYYKLNMTKELNQIETILKAEGLL